MLPPLSRRQMLQRTACGFGALAFHDLLQAAVTPTSPYANGVAPKAKRVIFLFMQGGPSQLDHFDPKSFINDRHGKSIDSPLPKQITQVGTEKFDMTQMCWNIFFPPPIHYFRLYSFTFLWA